MAEGMLIATVTGGVALAVIAAKAAVGWVVDRIPARQR